MRKFKVGLIILAFIFSVALLGQTTTTYAGPGNDTSGDVNHPIKLP